jgi:hypothetical protein
MMPEVIGRGEERGVTTCHLFPHWSVQVSLGLTDSYISGIYHLDGGGSMFL